MVGQQFCFPPYSLIVALGYRPFMYRSNWSFTIPPGKPRAFDCASCPGRGNLNVALEGWGIWTRFISSSSVICREFFRFLQGLMDFQGRISPLLVNNALKTVSKWSLKVSWRHISLTSMNSVWLKTKFVFEERYFSNNRWGIWTAFLPRGEGIWTSQSSKVQMPGGLPGGLPGGDVEASIWLVHHILTTDVLSEMSRAKVGGRIRQFFLPPTPLPAPTISQGKQQ